jgi:hypothetical protein
MDQGMFENQDWLTDFSGIEGLPAGMLGHPEAALLHRVARDYFQGYGDIIDAGAFLGASSWCLAKGLEENGRVPRKSGRLHAYDIFQIWNEPGETDAHMAQYLRQTYGVEMAGYESTVGIYTANLGHLARHVRLHQGDVLKERWSGRPIEILFVDICKTRRIWQHMLSDFFPSLIPGVSLVIHQDWHHPFLPYLHVAQEFLSEYFEVVAAKASDSAVFRLIDRIPERRLDEAAEYGFTPADEIRLMDAAIARFEGNNRFLKLAKAELLRLHGRYDEASEQAHRTYVFHGEPMTQPESDYFGSFAGTTAGRIEAHELGRTLQAVNFDEAGYLASNPDVDNAVKQGWMNSGGQHWYRHGRWNGHPPGAMHQEQAAPAT